MLTYANQLTILRMVFVPVFVMLVVYGHMAAAVTVFIVAGITDTLDGLIARRFSQKTPLGTYLDPIADKLLLVSSFIVLTLRNSSLPVQIPLWLTITVISRDVLIVVSVVIITLTMGRRIFLPSVIGKATTAAQLLTVFAVMTSAVLPFLIPIVQPLMYATLVLTVASGLHYLIRGMKIFEYNREQVL